MKKLLKSLPAILLGGAIGGCIGAIAAMQVDSLGQLLIAFVLLFAAAYLQLILHEAGHLIAGLLTGYTFVSFRIGSIMLLRRRGRYLWARHRLAGTGGQCLMAPPPLQGDRYPCVLYHLGGVLMNLLCALLAILAWWKSGFSAFWLGTAASGLLLALINGLPLKLGAVDNDGRNALRSCREAEVRLGFYRQLQINAALTDGQRLRELPEEWFACAPGQERERAYTRFQWLLDRGEYAQALDYGRSLPEGSLLGLHRALLENDLRSLALLAGETPDAPSPACRQVMKAMPAFPAVLRGQYICALLQEDDPEKANIISKRFEKATRAYPYPGDVQVDGELMALARQKYETPSAHRG